MQSIEDLPYPVGTALTNQQKDVLIAYNRHDVLATRDFYIQTIPMIEFREELSEKYDRNFLNHNDTKIGKDYFIMKLEGSIPGACYTPDRKPRQTRRPAIALNGVIFPYINFENPEFQRVKDYLASVTISEKTATDELLLKGVFTGLNCTVDGFTFDFGSGGIHGSISSQVVCSDDDYIIEDWDVASYYPNLAIANRLYPEHLSDQFCDIYEDVFNQRRQFKKGTVENAMLKLALNGVYGDSNNKYSPFYDPQYTMSITINGQLLLCLLAQFLMKVQNLQMIQINTDGLTVKYPRVMKDYVHSVCHWWEGFTKLELENVEYSRMFVRDVNNYIGEYTDGKVKRKGAYEYEVEWHKDHSALIVPKAAEAVLVHGRDLHEFIYNHNDDFDFMLRAKVGRADKLMLNGSTELQRITRYYVAQDGGSLTKVSPPAKDYKVGQWRRANGLTDSFYHSVCAELRNRPSGDNVTDVLGMPWDERIHTKSMTKYGTRTTAICKGYKVGICDNVEDFSRSNLNYDYYIVEATKLIEVLK
jgi:hypothetical protein